MSSPNYQQPTRSTLTKIGSTYIKYLIDIVIFLGRQGLPFRGHRENDVALNKGKDK